MAQDDVEQQQEQATDEEVGLAVLDAARYGDLEDLRELAQTYGSRHLGYQGANNGGNTALHYGTVDGGVVGCVVGIDRRWHVGLCFDPSTGWLRHDTDGRHNLFTVHSACANGHVECAAWLLEQGVEGSPANDSGNTPLRKWMGLDG
jgi:hypothetical protein